MALTKIGYTLIKDNFKDSVSGSSTAHSASFSSRVTTAESELENTIVSSSAQISTDISGSLGANASTIRTLSAATVSGSRDAASISGSLGANAGVIRTLSAATVSGSRDAASISGSRDAASISGSLGANAGVIRTLSAATVSGSFGNQRVGTTDDVKFANITGSNNISASGNLSITGNLDIDGTSNFAGNVTLQNDLTVTGRIDAEEIHTTFISSSIAQATGSNIFGDRQDDIHQFTGSIQQSGSSANHYFQTGNVGIGTNAPATKLDLNAGNFRMTDDYVIEWGGTNARINGSNANDRLKFYTGDTTRLIIDSSGDVGIGTTSPRISTAWGSTNSKYLTVTNGSTGPGILTLSADRTGTGQGVGRIEFTNANNADASNNDADGKTIASVTSNLITSDSNSGDDSGGEIQIHTKPEAGSLAERMRIDSSGDVKLLTDGATLAFGADSETTLQHIHNGGLILNSAMGLFFRDNGGEYIYSAGDGDLRIHSGTKIHLGANVGIGTTTVDNNLHIYGTSNPTIKLEAPSGERPIILFNTATTTKPHIQFAAGDVLKSYIEGGGNDDQCIKIFTSGSANEWKFTDSNQLSGSISSTGSFGMVGIGTASPSRKLEVAGGTIFGAHDGGDVVHINRYNSGSPNAYLYAGDTDRNVPVGLIFGTRGTDGAMSDKMIVSSSGNVGIGTMSPTTNMSANQIVEIFSTGITSLALNGNNGSRFELTSDTGDDFKISRNGSTALTIDGSNNYVGIGVAPTAPLYVKSTATNTVARIAGGSSTSTFDFNIVGTNSPSNYSVAFKSQEAAGSGMAFYTRESGGDVTEKMVIKDDGSVGIGTNNPGNLLHVSQSGASGNWVARFQNNNTVASEVDIQMGYANSSGRNSGISVTMDDTNTGEYLLALTSGGTERMRVRADGKVGIGTATPDSQLHVHNDNGSTYTAHFKNGNGTAPTLWVEATGNDANDTAVMKVDVNSATRFMISNEDGNVGIGTTAPADNLHIHGSVPGLRLIDTGNDATAQIGYSDGSGFFLRLPDDANNEDVMIRSYGDTFFNGAHNTSHLVGIGTNNPKNILHVGSGSASDPISGATQCLIMGNNQAFAGTPGNLCIQSTDAQDADKGGMLGFAGERANNQSGALVFAGIAGRKENNTNGNYAGYLHFATRANGGSLTEKMRIESDGNVGIGTNNAAARLHVEDAHSNAPLVQLEFTGGGGKLIAFVTNGSENGDITEAAGTVSLNGFQGAHQTNISGSTDTNIKEGTVISTTDILYKQNHPQCKISDTENDTRVYGVLGRYVSGSSDFVVASVGVGSVRVTGSCAGGDLLVSAGDGCAKVNNSGTLQTVIGKVTANISGSATEDRLIPCVLYCG